MERAQCGDAILHLTGVTLIGKDEGIQRMMMITDTGVSLKIKQTDSHQTVFHVHMYPKILSIHYHKRRISNTGKNLKTPDTGIGTKNSPLGNNMMI